jgi:hypothetical protein
MNPLILVAAAGTGLYFLLRKKAPPPPSFTPAAASFAPAAGPSPRAQAQVSSQDQADQSVVDAAFENLGFQSAEHVEQDTLGPDAGSGAPPVSALGTPRTVTVGPAQDSFVDPGSGLRAPGPPPEQQVEENTLANTFASLDPFGSLFGDDE